MSTTQPPLDLPVALSLIPGVKERLPAIFVGFGFATTLYGFTISQLYFYYKSYPKDHVVLKLMVWALDTFTTILVAQSIYTLVVYDFDDVEADTVIQQYLESEIVVTVTLIAQSYFAFQLFQLSQKVMAIGIFMVSVAVFCVDISKLFVHSQTLLSKVATPVTQSIHALPCVMINSLICYTGASGFLTAICQIMSVCISVVSPHHTYWQAFHQAITKLYVSSVVASLNFRSAYGNFKTHNYHTCETGK
ncbi:hypothetical protein BDP27DRAFT_1340221 [Rhodocollybia butyracea]|uniref:DUF6534 domain-containing protein n=1 Tax=Rhodocollybia butyracea TaxID=206335 RepID=A0A9P5TZA8_9AGAR|nr:hypothetical protein BDP27DRAFT_1340221 [Rhodocollybia butyracea]